MIVLRYIVLTLLLMPASMTFAKSVDFKWKKISSATKYQLEVSKSDDFESPILSTFVSEPLYVKELEPGIYYMRVRAFGENEKKGRWSSARQLTVTPEVFAKTETAPQVLKYLEKIPEVKSERALKQDQKEVQVTVTRDGKKLIEQNISGNTFAFAPEGAGKYVVAIRTNTNGVYGRPTVVSQVTIQEDQLDKPSWRLEQDEWSFGKKIELEWSAIAKAKKYRIKLYKRSVERVQVFETTETQLTLPTLQEGHYTATVEAISGKVESGEAEANITVSSTDMLKIKKTDIEFGLGFGYLNYESQLSDAASPTVIKNAQSFRVYGRSLVNLSQSSIKLDIRSGLTSFSYLGGTALSSDIQIAPGISIESGLCSSCRFLISAGPKLWTIPLLARAQTATGSVMESTMQTLFGPVLNAEIQSKFGRRSLANITASVSSPLSVSEGTRDDLGKKRVEPTFNYKIGANLLTPITPDYTTRLGVEYESQSLELTNNSVGKVTTKTSSTTLVLGLSSTVGAHEENKKLFSDFELMIGALYDQGTIETKSLHYSGHIFESTDFYGEGLGWQMRGQGWFRDSVFGLRAESIWKSFGSNGRRGMGYADYALAPRLRLSKRSDSKMTVENYLGLATHTLPVFFEDTSLQKLISSTATFGIVEGLAISKTLSAKLSAMWTNEVYYPLSIIGKSGGIKQLNPTLSYKSELLINRKFGSTLGFGLGLGYKFDEFRYTSEYSNTLSFKTIQRAPYLSFLGVLGF